MLLDFIHYHNPYSDISIIAYDTYIYGLGEYCKVIFIGGYLMSVSNGSGQAGISNIVGTHTTVDKIKFIYGFFIGGSSTFGITSDNKVIMNIPNSTFSGNLSTNFIVFAIK